MPKLPVVSGRDLIKFLKKLDYEVVRQRGSHVRLRKETEFGVHNITIPYHEEIAKGTLNAILTDISKWNNISKDELLKKLK